MGCQNSKDTMDPKNVGPAMGLLKKESFRQLEEIDR
jgi:hypothetical protein